MQEITYTEETSRLTINELDNLLHFCVQQQVSDVTLQSNSPVAVELHGVVSYITKRNIIHAEIENILNEIYGANGTAQLLSGIDLDTHYEIKPQRGLRYRFRVNATGCLVNGAHGIQITLRVIPNEPPTLANMKLPKSLMNFIVPWQGIVIVAGATGSGKTTLLAAILREILENHSGKILTYESPIEFVYDRVKAKNAIISQTEIPKNLASFPTAVRNALRRKPNYILVGEARDTETIGAVIDAALTGHTVYTTVHSNGVVDTIRRMVASFPQDERYGRTVDLLSLTKLILWQTLVKTTDEKRAPAREWLVITPKIRDYLLNCL